MRIALTGATGFVGKQVLAALKEAGHDVSMLVRGKTVKPQAPARIVVGDLENSAAIKSLVEGAEVVLHLAGAITAFTKADYFKVNFNGTRKVFDAALAAGVKRFVHVSSLAARLPGISPYAASKRAAEDFLLNVKAGPPVLILRPCAVYGPGDKATLPLLAALQKRVALLPGTSTSRFSLIHVDDLTAVILDAVQSSRTGIIEVDDVEGGHNWAELAAISSKNSGSPQHVTYLPKALMQLVALAFEGVSFFTQRPGMINRAKVRELYNEDWVVRGTNWPRPHPILLSVGLNQTLNWYRSEGLLPPVSMHFKSS